MKICTNIWNRLGKCLLLKEEDDCVGEPSLEDMLEAAHKEVQEAENLFSRVGDEEMIDCAILYLQAAEKRYNFLLKTVRKREKADKAMKG